MNFTKVSGLISNLAIHKGRENIFLSAHQKNFLGLGAIGAAAIGDGLSSTILAGASDGLEMEMEVFTCMVGNEKISGSFYKVEFENGQNLDFAIEENFEGTRVHAALDRSRRMIWPSLYRTKGHIAQRKSNIIGSIATSISASVIFSLLGLYTGYASPSIRLRSAKMMGCIAFFMTLFVCYRICRRVYRGSTDATMAFNALGFIDPANVNLPKGDRAAEKRYARETGQPEQRAKEWRFRIDERSLKS